MPGYVILTCCTDYSKSWPQWSAHPVEGCTPRVPCVYQCIYHSATLDYQVTARANSLRGDEHCLLWHSDCTHRAMVFRLQALALSHATSVISFIILHVVGT